MKINKKAEKSLKLAILMLVISVAGFFAGHFISETIGKLICAISIPLGAICVFVAFLKSAQNA